MSVDAIYTALTTPAGVYFVSDHGSPAMILVSHPTPDQVTIKRVVLDAFAPLEVALRHAHLAGALPSQQLPTIEVAPAPPAQLTTAPVDTTPIETREPCPNGCGTLLIPGKPGRHLSACPNKPQQPATQEQAQEAAQEEPCSDPQ